MTKFLKTAAFAAAVGMAAPALAQDIIVVSHGQANDPFWSVVKNGVDLAAQHTGANVEYRAPETFDMVAMSQLIDAAVNQEPDGIVVSIPDGDALGPSIMRATQAGIPVISMNSGSDVAAELGAALHVGVEQPFDDEQCAFDPADLPQGQRQIMLPRARGQFLEEVTWLHPARQHCCDTAQNIRPVFDDLRFPNFVPG